MWVCLARAGLAVKLPCRVSGEMRKEGSADGGQALERVNSLGD